MRYEPTQKIVRKSGNYFTTAVIQPQMMNYKDEFEARSYFIYSDNKQKDVTALTIANKYGAGVQVEILKVGEKRNTSLSFELGLDEVEMMIQYLQSIKSKIHNYSGEIISKI